MSQLQKITKKINIIFILRLIIGGLYVFAGSEKLFQPIENFVYVIQGYDFLRNLFLERMVGFIFPWVEYILGVFLILGLWVRLALIGIGTFSTVFIVVIGQAILRKLPIEECGCFGDLVKVPLQSIFIMDILIVSLIIIMYFTLEKTSVFSLDNYFAKREL